MTNQTFQTGVLGLVGFDLFPCNTTVMEAATKKATDYFCSLSPSLNNGYLIKKLRLQNQMKLLQHQHPLGKYIRTKVLQMAHKVAKNQPINKREDRVDVQNNTGIDMGNIFQSTNSCSNTVYHIACEMRSNMFITTDFSRQNLFEH